MPKAVRDALGIEEGDEIVFRVDGNRAVLARTPRFLELAGTVECRPRDATSPGTRSWRRTRVARACRTPVSSLHRHEHPDPTPDWGSTGHGGAGDGLPRWRRRAPAHRPRGRRDRLRPRVISTSHRGARSPTPCARCSPPIRSCASTPRCCCEQSSVLRDGSDRFPPRGPSRCLLGERTSWATGRPRSTILTDLSVDGSSRRPRRRSVRAEPRRRTATS